MEVHDGSIKVELKHLPNYAAIGVLVISWLNPSFLNDLTSKYLSNVVYLLFILLGFAYVNGFHFFHEIFNLHRNDSPHEYEAPAGTQKFHIFDGNVRVVLLLHKETVLREIHREVLLLGNGTIHLDDGVQPTRGRGQNRGGGTQVGGTNVGGTNVGGTRRATRATATIQNEPHQVDTHVHLRLVVSTVEPDRHHWSYWLSYFGYETKKIERVKHDQSCTL